MKKILLFLSLSLFSLGAIAAATVNEVVQTFPVQLTSDDTGGKSGSNPNMAYTSAYQRVMNQKILQTIDTSKAKDVNLYISILYDFAGMAFVSPGTGLEDNIVTNIKGGFTLSQGENKYLYQEQAQIYNMFKQGASPSQVKNYIDTTSRNVLSKVVTRGNVGIQTTPDTPDISTSTNGDSSGGSSNQSNSQSSGGFKLNY